MKSHVTRKVESGWTRNLFCLRAAADSPRMRRGCLVGGSVANATGTLELHPTVDAECSSHPGSSYPTADTRARVGWA